MKFITLTALIALALVVASCTGGGGAQGYSSTNYRTGSQGLYMQFLQNQVTVFEGEELSIALEFWNRGTADITRGQFFVKGYDPAYLSPQFDPSPYFQIDGKDQYDPNGEISQIITINDPRVGIPEARDEFTQELQVIACYEYETIASVPICVDPDPANRRIENKVCQGGAVSPGAQGHPIAVTSVDQKTSTNDIRFNLVIQNVGDGTVYDRRVSTEQCGYDLQRQDTNKVYVRKVSFSNKVLDCEPDNPITLSASGRGIFACSCTNCINELDGAFETTLTVEFDYGYRNTESAYISILSDDII